MGALSFGDYFKYDYRLPLLVDKIYEKNDKSNIFATKFGVFKAEKLLIEGKEYKYSKNLYKRIEALEDETNPLKLVIIQGKVGTKTKNKKFR